MLQTYDVICDGSNKVGIQVERFDYVHVLKAVGNITLRLGDSMEVTKLTQGLSWRLKNPVDQRKTIYVTSDQSETVLIAFSDGDRIHGFGAIGSNTSGIGLPIWTPQFGGTITLNGVRNATSLQTIAAMFQTSPYSPAFNCLTLEIPDGGIQGNNPADVLAFGSPSTSVPGSMSPLQIMDVSGAAVANIPAGVNAPAIYRVNVTGCLYIAFEGGDSNLATVVQYRLGFNGSFR